MPAGPLSPEGRQKMLGILLVATLVFSAGVVVRTVRVLRDVGGFSTYDRVKAVLVRRMNVRKEPVMPTAALTGLGSDELDRRELLNALNDEFEIDLPDSIAAGLVTVQDVVAVVDRHRARPHEYQETK